MMTWDSDNWKGQVGVLWPVYWEGNDGVFACSLILKKTKTTLRDAILLFSLSSS